MFVWFLFAAVILNSSGGSVDTIVFMALPHVRPIEQENGAIHIVIQRIPLNQEVLCFHEVLSMFADATRSFLTIRSQLILRP